MTTTMWEQIDDLLERDRYYNGAIVGENERCDRCGQFTLECVSDNEDQGGIHTWVFRCPVCGFEDSERW